MSAHRSPRTRAGLPTRTDSPPLTWRRVGQLALAVVYPTLLLLAGVAGGTLHRNQVALGRPAAEDRARVRLTVDALVLLRLGRVVWAAERADRDLRAAAATEPAGEASTTCGVRRERQAPR